MANYNTEEILRESQENVKKLNEKLKDIESLHNEIKESVSLSLKNPKLFKTCCQQHLVHKLTTYLFAFVEAAIRNY